MLRLALSSLLVSQVSAVSDLAVVIPDDNLSTEEWRVRVSFRGEDDETGVTKYEACACDSTGTISTERATPPAVGAEICVDNNAVDHAGTPGAYTNVMTWDQNKLTTPTTDAGKNGQMDSSYNSTTGIMTISNRGGYGQDEGQQLVLDGPGTLYTVHLDVEPRDDYIKIADKEGRDVFLTGNYSACLTNVKGKEKEYMDDGLAPGQHYSESFDDYHVTEETQNHQDDLCHNILTGKTLMPAPVQIARGETILYWHSDDDTDGGADSPNNHSADLDFFEGFELLFQFDDYYTADPTHGAAGSANAAATHVCVRAVGGSAGTASVSIGTDDQTGSGLPPSGAPGRVYFQDDDLNKLQISGTVEVQSAGGSTNTEQSYLITLEKFEPAGRWGYNLGQLRDSAQFSGTERTRDDLPYGELTVFGPRDTWGHYLPENHDPGTGSVLPYYPTGGSTNTEAPKLIGGGPPLARVFNKHGDVIPSSSRGMHPDYQGAEELINVQEWVCNCGSECKTATNAEMRCRVTITRQSGEPNGKGLQQSQGSPPAPMYQLRTRACGTTSGTHCDVRTSNVIQLIDIAEYEPKGTFYGDLDPKTRVLMGEITVVTPNYAMGLRGYRAYPTNDGKNNLPLIWSDNTSREVTSWAGASPSIAQNSPERSANPQFMVVLDKHCPPDTLNSDWKKFKTAADGGTDPNASFLALAIEPCGNDNPYSPKCLGKSCPFINILPGSGGEFYISRYDNTGNAENPQTRLHGAVENPKLNNEPKMYTSNTAQRNYSNNEYAEIYLPKSGWLTPIMMDVNEAVACSITGGTYAGDETTPYSAGEPCAQSENASAEGDELVLKKTDGSELYDLVNEPLSKYLDLWQEEHVIIWTTDSYDTAHGWTLIFQPNYPEITIPLGTPMAQAASGLRLVPIYHAQPTLTPLTDGPSDAATSTDGEAGELGEACSTCTCVGCAVEGTWETDSYVETYDWLVPNVTCTPTTMHCPLPNIWAHINYTTPSLYPEPAEGSCLQQKTGTSSLVGCSDKTDLNTRWYSANSPTTSEPGMSLKNTNEEDTGQGVAADTYSVKHNNWAGNCGDATSYFWFEKIACGSTRTFLTDRSLIEDFVQLTPTWEDIQAILDIYYTTKAPLAGTNGNDGFTFITADYNIPPVLPPKVNCSCMAAMDAYASLLSVVSKTPSPGAPVTLDPEVLNTGTSKIIATLRMYQDPTYSIPASSVAPMPIVVTRFYLEVSTKFTRNRITISDCSASNMENLLNDSTSLKPRMNYCDNSTFDTMTERAPNGVTHMDRLSMKKFKFQTTTDVFVQCKIRACAQQPCGICTGAGFAYRELQEVDMSPIEGEMFPPPVNVKVSPMDTNALVFPDTTPDFRAPTVESARPLSQIGSGSAAASSMSGGRPVTTKPYQIASNLMLSGMTAQWAIQNREAVTDTLRKTLSLLPSEELIITAISKVNRKLAEEKRALQTAGVKIDFVVGVSSTERAQVANTAVGQMSQGSQQLLARFSQQLDQELAKRGQAPVNLPTSALVVAQPVATATGYGSTAQSGSAAANMPLFQGGSWNAATGDFGASDSAAPGAEDKEKSSSNTGVVMGVVIGAFAMGFLALALYMTNSRRAEAQQMGDGQWQPDMYASKVASLDNQWMHEQQGMPQQGWGGEEQHYQQNQNQGWY